MADTVNVVFHDSKWKGMIVPKALIQIRDLLERDTCFTRLWDGGQSSVLFIKRKILPADFSLVLELVEESLHKEFPESHDSVQQCIEEIRKAWKN